MQVIRGLYNIRPEHLGCFVTIGNFDGVHLGHQALLKKLKNDAELSGRKSMLITFEPQPNEFFHREKIPPRLMRLHEKAALVAKLGIDYLLCLRFDEAFSKISAENFIQSIIIDTLRAKHIIVGDDFRFGQQRKGDFTLIQQISKKHYFTAEEMPTFTLNNERISSSLVRHALEEGDLDRAEKLLGRSFGMSGRIAHGDKRGRIIGFPTANIFLHRRAVPIQGVYAVLTYGIDDKPLFGVANVGTRPTVGGTNSLLEVHLFDFDREIYGHRIYVEFKHKLRKEKKFASFEELKQQIFKDAQAARNLFGLAVGAVSPPHV